MSQVYKIPVNKILMKPLKTTMRINLIAVFLGLGITIPLGIYCAIHLNSRTDKAIQVFTIVGHSVPTFIFALLFIFVFAVKLKWFPVSGMRTPNFKGTSWQVFIDEMRHLVLPLAVMTLAALAGITRYVRTSMAEALSMDYIRTARAKGLKEKTVIFSHAWRNALLSVITLIIGWFTGVVYGSLVLEKMFGINGLGKLLIDSLNNHDYNVVMAIQLFYMVVALLGNLISDLSYGLVDPRVRVNR